MGVVANAVHLLSALVVLGGTIQCYNYGSTVYIHFQ